MPRSRAISRSVYCERASFSAKFRSSVMGCESFMEKRGGGFVGWFGVIVRDRFPGDED